MKRRVPHWNRGSHIIVKVFDEVDSKKCVGFGVCDKKMRFFTAKTFDTANFAIEWADENVKGLG